MFHATQFCGHQYVSLCDCHPCSSQQAEATANCCTLKNHTTSFDKISRSLSSQEQFFSLSVWCFLFSDVWLWPAMLSCWPIFAPSWILLTHCHTRGFWIHCPSELPWYETCRKHWVCVDIRILRIKICLNSFIPIPSMHAIFTYIWLNLMVNVGKYTSPMDAMGYDFYVQIFPKRSTSPCIVRVLQAIRFVHIWSIPGDPLTGTIFNQ